MSELRKEDIADGMNKARAMAKSKTLVTMYMSEQDKASIQRALQKTSIEINDALVTSEETGEQYIVTRPLVRVYVPLLVTEVRITSDAKIRVTVDRSIVTSKVDPETKRRIRKEDQVSAFLRSKDDSGRIAYIFSVLNQLKRSEMRQLFDTENSAVLEVRSLILQVAGRDGQDSKMYPLPIVVEKGVVATLAKALGITVRDFYETVRGGDIGD